MLQALAHEGFTQEQEAEMFEYMRGMMGWGGKFAPGGGWFWGLHTVLALVTWLALIVFLIAAARYFWRKGGGR